jgi:hypothetical protein
MDFEFFSSSLSILFGIEVMNIFHTQFSATQQTAEIVPHVHDYRS